MFKLNSITKQYRPELNGLRGLAVILVLLYHLDLEWMNGGFLGVDIFLVISGYFISKNILFELQRGSFTFGGFYRKRLRRLFPALLFTLFAVAAAGYFLLTPPSFERLGQSTMYSAFSLSNFFFWGESGYFNMNATSKPLLHMWSLSLEEQFYLFWPLVLVLIYRFKRKLLIPAVAIFIVGSVTLSELAIKNHRDAVFFLIPFRMFEFLLGAFCIWLEQFAKRYSGTLLTALFGLGLLLMIGSGILLDGNDRMPGLLSLIPCSGAMMITFSGAGTKLSWTLKNKVVEYIGKASYSIYLIHWPLIVYFKYATLIELTWKHQIVLGLVSIGLGFAMWHFIENSFRYRKVKVGKLDPVWYVVPMLILVIGLGAKVVSANDLQPEEFITELYMTDEEIKANRDLYFEEYRKKGPLVEGTPGNGHVIVMGNSHSVDLIYALRQNGFEAKITALNSLGDCYNFGQSYENTVNQEKCLESLERNLNDPNWEVADAVFLHDNWADWDEQGLIAIIDKITERTDVPVFVIGPKMTFRQDVPDIIRLANTADPLKINSTARKFARIDHKGWTNVKAKNLIDDKKYHDRAVYYIDLLEVQSGKNLRDFEIISRSNLKFLYFDRNHFTKQGSKEFGAKLKRKYPFLFDVQLLNDEFSAVGN